MKAYKIIKDYVSAAGDNNGYVAGRILIKDKFTTLLSGDYTRPQVFIPNTLFWLEKQGCIEEIDLLKETWIHPHLYKPIQQEVKKQLNETNKVL